jgi:nicotinamide-nucleotide amidase
MTETNRQQAYLPEKCTMISNRAGTAPGMWFKENGSVFVSMPGVPHEMKIMMTEQVLPRLQAVFQTPVIFHKLVKTIGIGESWLADKIRSWEDQLPAHIKLAYLPGLGEVKLRLTATGVDFEVLEREVSEQLVILRSLAGEFIYGYDQDTLPLIIGRSLLKNNLTIATAESCSGGAVAKALTSTAGSSGYFIGSVIAYHNRIKIGLLGVKQETLQSYGAVSEETVIEMAESVRMRLSTDIGLAISGIAGPDGGTPDKPVGTIWVACADHEKTVTKKLSLYKDRNINIELTTQGVLNLLRQRLVEMDGEKV